MRIARFSYGGPDGAGVAFGVVEGDPGVEQITVIDGHPFGEIGRTRVTLPLAGVRLLPPILPSKVLGFGGNYATPVPRPGESAPPSEPVLFLKPSTSVVGPGAPVVYPEITDRVDVEGELAVVIGRLCRDVPIERVHEVVLGYTCANDVTARDLQSADGQWARSKGFDTFCPIGPWIETDLDPGDLRLLTHVNGELKQDARTSSLLHGVPELVAFASAAMTLLPGDVILTGTPAGVAPMVAGDLIEITIEGIGTLTNTVVAR